MNEAVEIGKGKKAMKGILKVEVETLPDWATRGHWHRYRIILEDPLAQELRSAKKQGWSEVRGAAWGCFEVEEGHPLYEILEGIAREIGLEKTHLGYKHVIIEGESGLLVHAGLLGYLKRRGRWRMDLSG